MITLVGLTKVCMQSFLNRFKILTFLVLAAFIFSSCRFLDIQALIQGNEDGNITGTPMPVRAAGTLIPDLGVSFEPDTQTYFPNPGMGWQDDHKHEEIPSLFQETIYYPVRKEIAWRVLNPAEDVYNWSVLDAHLERAVREGKQFSFRVYTMIDFESGHMVPDWVIEGGAIITELGDPNYSSCVYQEEWGDFVSALLERYDGDPNIAFIDISGYGNFNEWSWHDHQTEWDSVWDEAFQAGSAGPATMRELDAQARRRLADMFIGGSFNGHTCLDSAGDLEIVNYSYVGAARTQLVMPFAGIKQATQYVFLKSPEIGFRYDCLGRDGDNDSKVELIGERWKDAPVIFELCADSIRLEEIQTLLQAAHGSIVHNNDFSDLGSIYSTISAIGYRYYVTNASLQLGDSPGQVLLSMTWQNIGTSPNYPKMGQEFDLHVYLMNEWNEIVTVKILAVDTTQWLPGLVQDVQVSIDMPSDAYVGNYVVRVSLVERRTAEPIFLAFGTPDGDLRYPVASFYYK